MQQISHINLNVEESLFHHVTQTQTNMLLYVPIPLT